MVFIVQGTRNPKLRQTTPITVLLGEQNVTFALPCADRVYVLEHARIVWEGNPGRSARVICNSCHPGFPRNRPLCDAGLGSAAEARDDNQSTPWRSPAHPSNRHAAVRRLKKIAGQSAGGSCARGYNPAP
jgi:energy-coupling factor transporter ATP-binding protein EcfA2